MGDEDEDANRHQPGEAAYGAGHAHPEMFGDAADQKRSEGSHSGEDQGVQAHHAPTQRVGGGELFGSEPGPQAGLCVTECGNPAFRGDPGARHSDHAPGMTQTLEEARIELAAHDAVMRENERGVSVQCASRVDFRSRRNFATRALS